MSDSPFGLQHHRDFLYKECKRPLMADARTPEEFAERRTAQREDIRRRPGLTDRESPPITARTLQALDREISREEKIRLSADEGVWIALCVLIPKQPPPFKPVLVFPGHDPSGQYCAQDACSPAVHPGGHAYHNDLSQAWLARWL
jgi:hypothetical protein